MKKLNKDIIERIVTQYRHGNSLRIIAQKYCIGLGSAHKYISESGIMHKLNIVKELHSRDERLIGVYIGLWMGDGTQYLDKGYLIKICCNKENNLLNEFIQTVIYNLFGKKTRLNKISLTKQAYILYKSKFIFDFVYSYVKHEEKQKTYTIQLLKNIYAYGSKFLEGCLLGLILSDGYLKHRFSFNVISKNLAKNMSDILITFGFHPKIYIQRREKYGWKDLHMVSLNVAESKKLQLFLDEILKKLNCTYSFQELKYEPAGIRTPDLMMAEYHPNE